MLPLNYCRALAWLGLAAIIVLSVVPPNIRPTTSFPHTMEHVGIFLLVGFAFGISYFSYQWLLGMGVVTFCAVVELAQLMISGRHARLSDFFVDAIAAYIGIFAGLMLSRIRRRYR
jgi:VanZ family protein